MTSQNLIFFDIDGTLLDASGQIPPSAQKAIALAQKKGNLCFVNTGRPYSHLVPAVKNLPFDGYICSCGQQILLGGKTILHARFSPAEAKEIVALVEACHLDAVYEAEHGVWFQSTHANSPSVDHTKAHFIALGFDVDGRIDTDNFCFDKFCVWSQEDSDRALFIEKARSLCTVIEREGNLIELVRKGYSKETGIKAVIDHFGADIDCTYALGDSTNDLPMLRCVSHGIAMGNAPEIVQNAADYVTQTAEENGIYNALAHYGLI